ncbi:MAG: hypothetical protein GX887_07685 [Firmicutes bacterium]|nr:hypothetical protein [Bacillota bacterium]
MRVDTLKHIASGREDHRENIKAADRAITAVGLNRGIGGSMKITEKGTMKHGQPQLQYHLQGVST